MRRTYTSPFTGVTSIVYMNLAELEYEKLVEEIDNEKFEMEQRRQQEKTYPPAALESLSGTENFTEGAIKHIFNGEINTRGKAVGYHYEGIEPTDGCTILGTKTVPDRNGVYEAQVSVNGVAKRGGSTFFPREWSPQQVVNAVNKACENRYHVPPQPNRYEGTLPSGLKIQMYLNDGRPPKIRSAFPIKEPT